MLTKRVATVLPLLALLFATGLVVVLTRQLDATRQQRDLLSQRAQSLQPGAYVPLHSAPTLEGAPVALGEVAPGTRQVLFVYNTRCTFCLVTIPTWQRIADRYRGDPTVRVVAVSLDSLEATAKYARRHGLRYPTAVLTDPRAASLFRFNSVPQTLVIDERGRVMHSRLGHLDDAVAADSVLAAIARPLPGTTTTARSRSSARAPG